MDEGDKIEVPQYLVVQMRKQELKFKFAADKFDQLRLNNFATGSSMASAQHKLLLEMDILADTYKLIMEIYGQR